MAHEDGSHCVMSIAQMRTELTKAIQANVGDADMLAQLRTMRAACRGYLDAMTKDADVTEGDVVPKFILLHGEGNSWVETLRDPRFFEALRKLRTTFGEQLGAMADKFGITVEPELASIFP